MAQSSEKVIKRILEIDKNMVRTAKEMDRAFRERQKKVSAEIEMLETNILQEARKKAKREREQEIKQAHEEAETILERGQKEALALYDRFLQEKEKIISGLFKELI